MSTAVILKSKPTGIGIGNQLEFQLVEFQYGGCLGEFNGMSSLSQCRVLPLEFTVMIPEPRATLQGVRIPSAILTMVSRHISFYFVF